MLLCSPKACRASLRDLHSRAFERAKQRFNRVTCFLPTAPLSTSATMSSTSAATMSSTSANMSSLSDSEKTADEDTGAI
jgi:hypothetical protein